MVELIKLFSEEQAARGKHRKSVGCRGDRAAQCQRRQAEGDEDREESEEEKEEAGAPA